MFWNDVHFKGYIIDYTLFNMCDVHVQVFRHTDIYYSQCFDLIFASSVFVPQTFKIKTLFFYSLFLTFRQISDMNCLFNVKLPIMVNWLFLFCVYFIVVVVFFLLLVFWIGWRLVSFIIHYLINSSLSLILYEYDICTFFRTSKTQPFFSWHQRYTTNVFWW